MTQQNHARIFKIGTTTIVEDASMIGMNLPEIQAILQRTYPEIAHATAREYTREDGTPIVEWTARAGKKG